MSILRGTSFVKASDVVIPRIITSIQGQEKTGKSHLAGTAPGPIAWINLDLGTEGVLSKFTKDKELYVYEVNMPDLTKRDKMVVASESEHAWDQLEHHFRQALLECRTLVVDTATEMWGLLRMSRFGRLSKVMPHQYDEVNTAYRELIRKAYDSTCNLILIHKVKKQYLNDNWSGDYERAGFSDTGGLVQVNVETFRNEDGEFGFRVINCRQNPHLDKTEFLEPMNTFSNLGMMVVDGTSSTIWE